MARYECEFKERRRIKITGSYSNGMLSETIILYHNGKSSKLYTADEMSKHKKAFFIIYLLPIVVAIVVAKLLGYNP